MCDLSRAHAYENVYEHHLRRFRAAAIACAGVCGSCCGRVQHRGSIGAYDGQNYAGELPGEVTQN